MTPNTAAFLTTISTSEGCERESDPYAVCYAFSHVIHDFSNHPYPGEWEGVKLTDEQCRNAGCSPGCISTAAGRYQITHTTFMRLQAKLGTTGFAPQVQDDMCIQLIKEHGALDAVIAGNVSDAVRLCRSEWASLPGNTAGQPQSSFVSLVNSFVAAGGQLA